MGASPLMNWRTDCPFISEESGRRELRALADNGELADEAVYAAQVERLFGDDRAEGGFGPFTAGILARQHAESVYRP